MHEFSWDAVNNEKVLEEVWEEVTQNLHKCHTKSKGYFSLKVEDKVLLESHFLSNKAAQFSANLAPNNLPSWMLDIWMLPEVVWFCSMLGADEGVPYTSWHTFEMEIFGGPAENWPFSTRFLIFATSFKEFRLQYPSRGRDFYNSVHTVNILRQEQAVAYAKPLAERLPLSRSSLLSQLCAQVQGSAANLAFLQSYSRVSPWHSAAPGNNKERRANKRRGRVSVGCRWKRQFSTTVAGMADVVGSLSSFSLFASISLTLSLSFSAPPCEQKGIVAVETGPIQSHIRPYFRRNIKQGAIEERHRQAWGKFPSSRYSEKLIKASCALGASAETPLHPPASGNNPRDADTNPLRAEAAPAPVLVSCRELCLARRKLTQSHTTAPLTTLPTPHAKHFSQSPTTPTPHLTLFSTPTTPPLITLPLPATLIHRNPFHQTLPYYPYYHSLHYTPQLHHPSIPSSIHRQQSPLCQHNHPSRRHPLNPSTPPFHISLTPLNTTPPLKSSPVKFTVVSQSPLATYPMVVTLYRGSCPLVAYLSRVKVLMKLTWRWKAKTLQVAPHCSPPSSLGLKMTLCEKTVIFQGHETSPFNMSLAIYPPSKTEFVSGGLIPVIDTTLQNLLAAKTHPPTQAKNCPFQCRSSQKLPPQGQKLFCIPGLSTQGTAQTPL
ncbi:hypothetical protein PR048_016491 [Dryococelus australis]|uniref:Uncharacterized protein n=1 Tax=Dryococelus australis TaxID=614101 RepID=A0ABQ9HKB2_9NEOP|nr:hypothetical protein PR048_016491 [Dryococelus australis]